MRGGGLDQEGGVLEVTRSIPGRPARGGLRSPGARLRIDPGKEREHRKIEVERGGLPVEFRLGFQVEAGGVLLFLVAVPAAAVVLGGVLRIAAVLVLAEEIAGAIGDPEGLRGCEQEANHEDRHGAPMMDQSRRSFKGFVDRGG